MSQAENIELVHRAVDAWNRRDIEDLLALSDPEIEYVNSPTAVEPGTKRGSDEATAVLRAQWEILLDARWEIDRIYDHGDEIILLGRISRRMPGSEARIEDRSLVSSTIHDGKLTRLEVVGFGAGEVQEALKAAGLEE
jgi:ketosteroid isomerase-like protein